MYGPLNGDEDDDDDDDEDDTQLHHGSGTGVPHLKHSSRFAMCKSFQVNQRTKLLRGRSRRDRYGMYPLKRERGDCMVHWAVHCSVVKAHQSACGNAAWVAHKKGKGEGAFSTVGTDLIIMGIIYSCNHISGTRTGLQNTTFG